MPKLVAAFDRVNYTTSDGKGGRLFHSAARGETIDVDDDEAERLRAIDGAVVEEDEDVDPGRSTSTASSVEETALVAGFGLPEGHDIHDNARADLLARFAPTLAGDGATEPAANDDDIAAMTAEEVVAYLNQHNDEVDRVEAIETARSRGERRAVREAIDNLRDNLGD